MSGEKHMFMTIGLLPRIASAPDAPKWNDEVCVSRARVSRPLNEHAVARASVRVPAIIGTCHRSARSSARICPTVRSRTSTRPASAGCRSTTRRTCATHSRPFARVTRSRDGRDRTGRVRRAARAAARPRAGAGASGYVLFDPTYIRTSPASGSSRTSGRSSTCRTRPATTRSSCRSSRSSGRARSRRSSGSSRTPSTRARSTRCRCSPASPPTSGCAESIAADHDGYPGILGYRGPALSEVTGAEVTSLADEIERMIVRKSAAEIELIRESGRWCAHAHRLLQEYSRPGATEAEASLRAQQETTLAMLAALGSLGLLGSGDGVEGRLPRADRAAELVGARGRAQHRVPRRRRPRHGDRRARSAATRPSWSARS